MSLTNFGSTKAFGYGLSTCSANCFDNYMTRLVIDFGTPTFASAITFKEMELFENWGSDGGIFVDGLPLISGSGDFGRLPYNDRRADATFRTHTFDLNRSLTRIELRVTDITRLSEIAIDDISITAVPETGTLVMMFAGITVLLLRRRLGNAQ